MFGARTRKQKLRVKGMVEESCGVATGISREQIEVWCLRGQSW